MALARKTFLASGATLALLVGGLPAAHGIERHVVDDVTELIENVAPFQGNVAVGTRARVGVETRVEGSHTTVPLDPADSILLEEDSASGGPFEVNMPLELELRDGVVGSDGTVVFEGDGRVAHAAVQTLDQGDLRVQTITQDADGPHEFTYTFGEGFRPVETPEGGISIVKQLDDGSIAVVAVDDAWARDARGERVSTWYEIDGDSLVQVIEADESAAYPVVADPRFKWWALAYSAKFNRSETRTLSTAGGVTGMCVALARMWPGSAGWCAAYGAYIFAQAAIAEGAKVCILITATPPPLVFRYKDNDCY